MSTPEQPARRRATRMLTRTAGVGAAAVVALVASAGSAAAEQILQQEGADLMAEVTVGQAVLLYVLAPLVILVGVAALVWLPGMVRAERYRPQRGWSAAPVWFSGPPDPVAAVETAQVGTEIRGGSSGSW